MNEAVAGQIISNINTYKVCQYQIKRLSKAEYVYVIKAEMDHLGYRTYLMKDYKDFPLKNIERVRRGVSKVCIDTSYDTDKITKNNKLDLYNKITNTIRENLVFDPEKHRFCYIAEVTNGMMSISEYERHRSCVHCGGTRIKFIEGMTCSEYIHDKAEKILKEYDIDVSDISDCFYLKLNEEPRLTTTGKPAANKLTPRAPDEMIMTLEYGIEFSYSSSGGNVICKVKEYEPDEEAEDYLRAKVSKYKVIKNYANFLKRAGKRHLTAECTLTKEDSNLTRDNLSDQAISKILNILESK